VRYADCVKHRGQFAAWLRDVDKSRSDSEGVTLAVIPPGTQWSPDWVKDAADHVRRKTSSTKRFLRIVFTANADLAWQWNEERADVEGLVEFSLKPWREAALRRWMVDTQEFGPEAVNSCGEVLKQTGGWSLLVHAFGDACRAGAHNWRDQLETVFQSWPDDPRWYGCCCLPAPALPVLKVMADWNGPISSEELMTLAPNADVARILRWSDWLSYIREMEPDQWLIDPFVRALVRSRG
jgi:hypothetical protein